MVTQPLSSTFPVSGAKNLMGNNRTLSDIDKYWNNTYINILECNKNVIFVIVFLKRFLEREEKEERKRERKIDGERSS